MTTINLNDVEAKIDLVASLTNATVHSDKNNNFTVDWNLSYLSKYNKNRIFLCLENGVVIPNIQASATNNKGLMLVADGIQFRNRLVGFDEPRLICFLNQRYVNNSAGTTSSVSTFNNISTIGSQNYIFELETMPEKSITFSILQTEGNHILAETHSSSAIYQTMDLQFSLLIMKSLK